MRHSKKSNKYKMHLNKVFTYASGAGERIPTYLLVGTKFWGKWKDKLKAKFCQNSSVVGTKFASWHQVEKRSPAPVPRGWKKSNLGEQMTLDGLLMSVPLSKIKH